MACYYPLKGYKSRHLSKNGKRQLVFKPTEGYIDQPVEVPCGKCIGCRLEYSRQWAMRCIHEASLYNSNCFITLTYDNANLPNDYGLHVEHFQQFMKKLRKRVVKYDTDNNGKSYAVNPIRYYHCGEYGDENLRPHYHALLFNYDFPDKQLYSVKDGNNLYTSELLNEIWGKGFCIIGAVTFESAAYTARYIMKKITGPEAEEHYTRVNPNTGEIFQVAPEYTTMSRRPGIGRKWFEKYKNDCYSMDGITVRGVKTKVPKAYDVWNSDIDKDQMDNIQDKRRKEAFKKREDNTIERLEVKEKVKKSQIQSLQRNI